MSETTENTFSGYLGQDFQNKLMWQLLVEPEFAEKVLPDIAIEYFDDPNLKKLFFIIHEYLKEYGRVPNLQNKSINQAIHEFKTPGNKIEEESLFSVLQRVELWNERILNKIMIHDGEIVQKSTYFFIKQQEYRKLAEDINYKTKNGDIKNKNTISYIEERFQKIGLIGNVEDNGINVFDNISNVLRKEFRQTIPTGIEFIDAVTGGGLGKGEIGLILTPSGVGKAQPLSAKLLTPSGWIKMGDVKIDDFVVGSDGKLQKVLGVYPQGKRAIYKIEFNDNTSVYCDYEHLWSVNSLNQRTANTTIRKNGEIKHIKIPDYSYNALTTGELIKDYIKYKGNKKILNYRIPIVKPIEFNKNIVPINPYLLGILIGDGNLNNSSITFTNVDEHIINKVTNIINNDYDNILVKQIRNTISFRLCSSIYKKNQIKDVIKKLKLNVKSDNKFIPDIYKYNSIENRILLLQGLMDSDGYASKSGRVQYTTVSKNLANDVRELVLSLGGFCKISEKIPKFKYKNENKIGKKSYILTMSFVDDNIKIFSLDRKQKRVIYRDKYRYNKYISSIKYSHDEEAQCIFVENNDHLYVTDDYILTHNTTSLTKIANTAYEQGKNVAQIIFEDTPEQIQRKHYTIWSKIPLSEIDDKLDEVNKIIKSKAEEFSKKGGNLIIKKYSQDDNITIKDIRNWLINYQKKFGIKFDILILDYLDCVEPHKKSPDRNEGELIVVKGFEALAGDLKIPAWSALQGNRSSFNAEFIDAQQTGGSIKRIQKAHFFMSVAKTQEQKEAHLANIQILKARFAQDGQRFENCIYNNNTLEIRLEGSKYQYSQINKNIPHHDEKDIDALENMRLKFEENKSKNIELHAAISQHTENSILDIINNDNINENINNFENEKNNIPVETKNEEINIENIDKLLDISEEKEIEKINNEVNESISDAVNEDINSELLEISEDKVEINDVYDLPQINSTGISVTEPHIIENRSLKDIEGLFISPDAPQGAHKEIQDKLAKLREKQNVIKKE